MRKKKTDNLNCLIGQRLRQRRRELDYTQETVAEMLQVTPAFYGRIERGENGLTLERLVMLHEKLNLDLTYLLTGARHADINLDLIIQQCPQEKRFDMEQLVKYAMNLAKD